MSVLADHGGHVAGGDGAVLDESRVDGEEIVGDTQVASDQRGGSDIPDIDVAAWLCVEGTVVVVHNHLAPEEGDAVEDVQHILENEEEEENMRRRTLRR